MDKSLDNLSLDRFSSQLDKYLRLAHSSALLVSEGDKANLNILLTMLGAIDKDIFDAFYGLFGEPVKPVEQPAPAKKPAAKNLHRLSITPEWQMMMRQLKPIVQKRIGYNKE